MTSPTAAGTSKSMTATGIDSASGTTSKRAEPLHRDPHQVRAGAEDAGKASADRVRRAHEGEQDLVLFAREEERTADGGYRGPFVLPYDAPPHFRNRHLADRNDLIPRPQRVEPAGGALQLGAQGSVVNREIHVLIVGVDAHLRRMVQHRMQVRRGIVELHGGDRVV